MAERTNKGTADQKLEQADNLANQAIAFLVTDRAMARKLYQEARNLYLEVVHLASNPGMDPKLFEEWKQLMLKNRLSPDQKNRLDELTELADACLAK